MILNIILLFLLPHVLGNYRYNTYSPTPSPLDTLNFLVREIRKEVADVRKEMRSKLESIKYDITCEIKNLRDELGKSSDHGTIRGHSGIAEDIHNLKRRIQRALRGLNSQGDEIKNELRSQKAEMYAIRNSVYDSREELTKKNTMVLQNLENINGTFMCYLNDVRMNLFKMNTNFAMIKHDQTQVKDLIKLSQIPDPPLEESETTDPPERTDKNFLPGCTTNPLETQETLQTFGQKPIYSNISRPGYDTGYTSFSTPRSTVIDDVKSLYPRLPGDCRDAKKLFLEYPPMARDCRDVYELGLMATGVYRIQPQGMKSRDVLCDHDKDGGGWTVFVSRVKTFEHISFNQTWREYENGFGDPTKEYWIGLKTLYALTQRRPHEMRADLEDWEGNKAWASYSFFSYLYKDLEIRSVSGPEDRYRLRVSGYSGTAGDSMRHSHLQMFSTVDQDNDQEDWGSCPRGRGGGGWWWGRCACTQPTGQYRRGRYQGPERGVTWWHWKDSNYSLKTLLMKIRPKD